MNLGADPAGTELCLTLTPGARPGTCRLTAAWRRGGRVEPPAGITTGFDAERWEAQYLRPLAGFASEPPPARLLERFGAELAAVLLPQPIRAAVADALSEATGLPQQLRLRLDVRHPELARVPWEFTYLEEAVSAGPAGGFLALNPACSLVRGGEGPGGLSPEPADPLRLLVAWADPGSARYPPLAHLREELEAIRTVVRRPGVRHVRLAEVPYATPAALERALREQRPHALHFIGHGDTLPSGGVLVLHGSQPGAGTSLYAEEIAGWIKDAGTSLALLSACHTASSAGVAQVLADRGLPAVVAMQLPFRDAAAGPFARAFYTALLAGMSVEEAVREAREALWDFGADWGVPVLHLGTQHSALFRIAESPDAPPACIPPTNLPYLRNPQFVGRERLLAELHERLTSPAEPPVALVGMGGVGKTQVAVEYAHAHAAAYPGGVFWLNARDTARLLEDYASLGRHFAVPDSLPVSERAARVRDALQQLPHRCLLILDNVTSPDSLVLPVGGRCRFLVTTRERHVAGVQFRTLEVPPLGDAAALALLQAGRPAMDEELSTAREILDLLGNLPLGIALAAHLVERLDISYEECRGRLAGNRVEVLKQARRRFITATGHDGGIWDAIDLSHRTLTPAGQSVLATAACFSGRGISRELLREACPPETHEEFEEALADLVSASLASREQDGRLTLHELVRVYARGSLPEAELCATVDQVAEVLTRCLAQANESMVWDGVRRELRHCRTAAELCRACGSPAPFLGLLREMGIYYFQHRELAAAGVFYDEGLRLAREAGDLRATAFYLMNLAETAQHLERRQEALARAEEALSVARGIYPEGDAGLAEYYVCLGYVLKFQGEYARARECYEEALAIRRSVHGPRHPEVASCLNNIGLVLESTGELEEALQMLEDAVSIDRENYGPGHYTVAIRLNNIGRIQGKVGRWSEAAEHHRVALAIYERVYGRRHLHAAWSLYYLGRALQELGCPRDAIRHFLEALPILEEHYGRGHSVCRRVKEGLRLLGEEPGDD